MRIAIASSGLGHIARGIETWALDTAVALAERGVDVTLFAAGPVRVPQLSSCQVVKLMQSRQPGNPTTQQLPAVILPCLRRAGPAVGRLIRLAPGFTWRWGLKSGYGWEQWSFWRLLWPELRRGRIDILHVQDPMLAYWCRKFRKLGLVRAKEILAHGTEEPPEFLAQFDYVQHLAPWHKAQAELALCQVAKLQGCRVAGKETKQAEEGISSISHEPSTVNHSQWTAIPNFVDTDVFKPAGSPEVKAQYRRELGIPADAFVVIAVGALKRGHKRVDWIIREFARFAASADNARLLLVGASTPDTPAILAEAGGKAGDRIVIMANQSRETMPRLLAAADIFVHGALFEMMPIAFLEAMASGLPIVSHGHPVMQWMAGDGRADVNMTKEGLLAEELHQLRAAPQVRTDLGRKARERALQMFAKEVVVDQMLEMYRAVTQREQGGQPPKNFPSVPSVWSVDKLRIRRHFSTEHTELTEMRG